jgi:predicted lipase
MKNKINLITVVGHQHKIIPHFINHYKNMVDNLYFIVHKTDEYDDIITELKKFDISPAKIIYEEKYNWRAITDALNDFKRNRPEDWWVITDTDELQIYPKPLKQIIDECEKNGYEIVYGLMIDRIGVDGKFPEITDENIWETFPNAGNIRELFSKATIRKVSIVKGKIDVTVGQHLPKFNGKGYSGVFHPKIYPIHRLLTQIHHFKWDVDCLDRLKNVATSNQTEYSFWMENKKMYEHIKNTHRIDLTEKKCLIHTTTNEYKSYKYFDKLIEISFFTGGKLPKDTII